jgi:hypothetical protein
MCWYSQHERVDTRKAIEGEELFVRDFPGHGRWLASPEEAEIPVCLTNGCKMKVSDIPQNLQRELKVGSEAVAEFREIYQRSPNSLLARIFLPPKLCFDVALFSNGRCLEFSAFPLGARVDILSPAIVGPIGTGRKENENETLYVEE